MNHPASEELSEAQKRIHTEELKELSGADFTKLSAGEQFAALENRRRAHIRLSKTDPEYTIKQARDYIPEERQFLIRKDEFDQLKEEREQFVATGGTGFDENWWKTAMGWNRESLYSGLQNAGKFFTPDILGQITGRACLSSLKSYQLTSDTKNRLRDRFSNSKSRRVTRQIIRADFHSRTGS
jgi:hypothetical protein